jgi:hypothetical protein
MTDEIKAKFKLLPVKVVIHRLDGTDEEIELPCEVVEQPEEVASDGKRTDERG